MLEVVRRLDARRNEAVCERAVVEKLRMEVDIVEGPILAQAVNSWLVPTANSPGQAYRCASQGASVGHTGMNNVAGEILASKALTISSSSTRASACNPRHRAIPSAPVLSRDCSVSR